MDNQALDPMHSATFDLQWDEMDITGRLTFIAKSRESDLNDDGHEIMEGVAEIERLRCKLKDALQQIRDSLPHGLVLCEDVDGKFFVDDAPGRGDF